MTTYVAVPGSLNAFFYTPGYQWLITVVGHGNYYFKYLDFGIEFDRVEDALMFKLKFLDNT